MAYVWNKATASQVWVPEPGQPNPPPGPPPSPWATQTTSTATAAPKPWVETETKQSAPLQGTQNFTFYQTPAAATAASGLSYASGYGGDSWANNVDHMVTKNNVTPAPPPPPAPTMPTPPPGVLTTPGAYEQWYAANKGNFSDRYTAGQAYNESLKRQYGNEGIKPTNTANAYSVIAQNFMQPSQGSENARSVASQLGQAGQGEGYLNQAASYFQGPNMTSNYAGSVDPRAFNTSGASENFYNYAAPQLAGRGAGEQNAYGLLPGFQQRGAAETNNDRAVSSLINNNATRDVYGQMMGSNFMGKNIVGDEFGYFQPQLREASNSEDLYASGNQGLNTYYDREYQKRSRRLQDQMASMGVFGSGATGRGLYELEGELGAAQARDMASLAAQADQARIARAGAAESFASKAGGEELARYGQGLQAAMGADESTRGNVAAMTDAASIAQQMQIDRMFKGGTLGLDADAAGRERMQLAGDLAGQSDEAKMNRLQTGSDIYKAADDSRFTQGTGLANTGNQLATQSLNRLNASADAGLAADQEDRTRLNDMFRSATSTDQGILNAETFNRDTARGLDDDYGTALDRGGAAAQVAQNMFETRERYPIQDQMGLSNSMANLSERARTASTAEQGAIANEMINTLMTSAGLSRQAAEQQVEEMYKSLGIGLQGLSFLKPK